jgi:hypothetical protein
VHRDLKHLPDQPDLVEVVLHILVTGLGENFSQYLISGSGFFPGESQCHAILYFSGNRIISAFKNKATNTVSSQDQIWCTEWKCRGGYSLYPAFLLMTFSK